MNGKLNLNKCVIIFSGFNQRAVITFLRTLRRHHIDYAIIAKSEEDEIFLTEYKHDVLAVRRSIPLDYEDVLESILIVQKKLIKDRYIIAPTSEALNRFILAYRERFIDIGCEIPVAGKELYEAISDKICFRELCSRSGINVPKELIFEDISVLPVVAKPKKYYSSRTGKALSPIIIEEPRELTLFGKKHHIDDYYFQEYVSGRSFYLLYYFSKSGRSYSYSQENIIQQPGGKSIVAAVSSDFHISAESKKYEHLFKNLNFVGLVMVEVRQRNGINYMIEANPRFWGPSQLFVDAGNNFFDVLLYDNELLDNIPKFVETQGVTRYFWFGGIINVLRNKENLVYHQGNEMDLLSSLPAWLESDIYRREDTLNVFKKEIVG